MGSRDLSGSKAIQKNLFKLCHETVDLNGILLDLLTTGALTSQEFDSIVSKNYKL